MIKHLRERHLGSIGGYEIKIVTYETVDESKNIIQHITKDRLEIVTSDNIGIDLTIPEAEELTKLLFKWFCNQNTENSFGQKPI